MFLVVRAIAKHSLDLVLILMFTVIVAVLAFFLGIRAASYTYETRPYSAPMVYKA